MKEEKEKGERSWETLEGSSSLRTKRDEGEWREGRRRRRVRGAGRHWRDEVEKKGHVERRERMFEFCPNCLKIQLLLH